MLSVNHAGAMNDSAMNGGGHIVFDLKNLIRLKHLVFTALNLAYLKDIPQSLETLETGLHALARPEHADCYPPLPHLRELRIYSHQVSTFQLDHFPLMLLPSKGKLEVLNVDFCGREINGLAFSCSVDRLISTMLDHGILDKVAEMRLGFRGYLQDSHLEAIAGGCEELRSLDLAGCHQITGVGIKALVLKRGKKIQFLCLRDCSGISPDAVVFARKAGINVVDVVYGSKSTRTRKMRYA